MALADLLQTTSGKKIGISEDRLRPLIPDLRKYVAVWREYPDLFVDFMQRGADHDKKVTFNLYTYQRVFLRIAMRYKYVYAVYPRACDECANSEFISVDKLL